jgi:hypothetical protein
MWPWSAAIEPLKNIYRRTLEAFLRSHDVNVIDLIEAGAGSSPTRA